MTSENYLDNMTPHIHSKVEGQMTWAELKRKQLTAEVKYGIAMAELGKLIVSVARRD